MTKKLVPELPGKAEPQTLEQRVAALEDFCSRLTGLLAAAGQCFDMGKLILEQVTKVKPLPSYGRKNPDGD